jgi:hypothetical protein
MSSGRRASLILCCPVACARLLTLRCVEDQSTPDSVTARDYRRVYELRTRYDIGGYASRDHGMIATEWSNCTGAVYRVKFANGDYLHVARNTRTSSIFDYDAPGPAQTWMKRTNQAGAPSC